MTTQVTVSIPYIHPGDEVVVQVYEGSNIVAQDIIRLIGTKDYTIWGSKHIEIHERRKTNE